MTFQDRARINHSHVQKRGRSNTGAKVGFGGIGVALVLYLISQVTGLNLMPFAGVANDMLGTGGGQGSSEVVNITGCETGADANTDDECRMIGAADALDQFWSTQVSNYRPPQVILFDDRTISSCGEANNNTGPFYCPPEEQIYLDTAFFQVLTTQYGGSDGSLAQMYVLAHEWGHHISQLIGTLDQADRGSGATSGSVRLELQADCFAGAWMRDATVATDETGTALLKPITDQEMRDALEAAAAIGDDHIMERAGMRVNPDRFTHGTSEQRQRWLFTGFEQGATACNTFDVADAKL